MTHDMITNVGADLASLMDDPTAAAMLAPYVPDGVTGQQLLAVAVTLAQLLAERPEVRRALLREPSPEAEAAAYAATLGYLAQLAQARAALLQARGVLALRLSAGELTDAERDTISAISAALRPRSGSHALQLLRAAGPVADWLHVVSHGQIGTLDWHAAYDLISAGRQLGIVRPSSAASTYRGWTITPHSLDGTAWHVRWTHPDRGPSVIDGPLPGVTTRDGAVAHAQTRIDAIERELASIHDQTDDAYVHTDAIAVNEAVGT